MSCTQGRHSLYPEIPDELLVQAAVDERHLELLRAVGFRSVLIVAMRVGEEVLGAITLVSAESARTLDQFDVELAEQIGARAAVAIENSRLYSERSAIARTLQRSLLPEQLPEISGYELASIYLPAVETSMVGGDFYDVWELGEDWMVLIGDVTGKGIEAAALTSLVRHTLRTASEFHASPAKLLSFVDATLKKRPTLSVCTALCLRLQDDRATLAVGGHPLPLHVTPEAVREVGEHGPLLGAFANVRWQDFTLRLDAWHHAGGLHRRDHRGTGEARGALRLATTARDARAPRASDGAGGDGRLAVALEQFRAGTCTPTIRPRSRCVGLRGGASTAAVPRRTRSCGAGTITTPA